MFTLLLYPHLQHTHAKSPIRLFPLCASQSLTIFSFHVLNSFPIISILRCTFCPTFLVSFSWSLLLLLTCPDYLSLFLFIFPTTTTISNVSLVRNSNTPGHTKHVYVLVSATFVIIFSFLFDAKHFESVHHCWPQFYTNRSMFVVSVLRTTRNFVRNLSNRRTAKRLLRIEFPTELSNGPNRSRKRIPPATEL